jgi:hypothetical protein
LKQTLSKLAPIEMKLLAMPKILQSMILTS